MSQSMSKESCVLLFIDWQVRLFPVMPEKIRENNLKNASNLKWLAEQLGIPTLFSEQYPKGLGPTLDTLQPCDPLEKVTFSVLKTTALSEALSKENRPTVILSGMETHICVLQSAQDLVNAGYKVWVPADAVLSRHKLDWKMGLQTMVSMGCQLTSTESLCFSWLESAKNPHFKAFSKRIR